MLIHRSQPCHLTARVRRVSLRGMDPLRMLIETQGFFTRAQARDLGWDDRAVGHAMRAGAWLRFRRGYYTYPEVWSALDEVGRHLVRCRAVMHSLGDAVVLSHVSACLLHGISVWGIDLSRVHVTRVDGGPGRIEGDVVHHEGFVADHEIVEVNGVRAVIPVRASVEAASRATSEKALVIVDSLLANGLADDDELMRQFELMEHWPFTQHLHIPIRMADGRSKSAGESRGKWLFRCSFIPAPELQYEVRDPSTNELLGTTDWAWPELGALGEFDGKVKYGRNCSSRDRRPAMSCLPRSAAKNSSAAVSGLPRMIRLIWADSTFRKVTAARVRTSLDIAS